LRIRLHCVSEQRLLESNLKYWWQKAVLAALREAQVDLLPGKIAEAERVVSERLVQEVADPDERLALRGAVIALECVRHASTEKH
jgi:hypothetical protein